MERSTLIIQGNQERKKVFVLMLTLANLLRMLNKYPVIKNLAF